MDPLEEYRTRRANWVARQQLAQRTLIAIGNCRLLTAIGAAVLASFAFWGNSITGWWLLAPLAVFVFLVVWHQPVFRRRTFAERAIHFYDHATRRIHDTWPEHGSPGDEFKVPNHIYAEDLDLFGQGSLFQLLSGARTASGEKTLATWLLTPASLTEASDRQEAVRELAPKLDLREEMALLGEDIKSGIQAELVTVWGSAVPVGFPPILRTAALALSLVGIAALILKFAGIWPAWPILVILAINAVIMFVFRNRTARALVGIESWAHSLSLLSQLVARLEEEQFTSARLTQVHNALRTNSVSASRRIKQLDRWLDLLDSSDHVLLRILGPLLLYRQQLVMAIEAWRCHSGAAIGGWINALADFEALSSISALHYERPSWVFPALESSPAACFEATDLGHPLVRASLSVRNSLTLNGDCRLLIVSGSNMSGKSTLLRAVGLNTVLAWTGAPVCATYLHVSPLQVGASIRISDSLQDNRSRFFAEISRLREIVELTKGTMPVLFLLDELLSGTNSNDRRLGAAGIVRGLLAANTIGLLTTHDLALSQLPLDAGAHIRNVHFEDRITGGKIEFDYQLRPGVVTHSNALELMRSIGLEI